MVGDRLLLLEALGDGLILLEVVATLVLDAADFVVKHSDDLKQFMTEGSFGLQHGTGHLSQEVARRFF